MYVNNSNCDSKPFKIYFAATGSSVCGWLHIYIYQGVIIKKEWKLKLYI